MHQTISLFAKPAPRRITETELCHSLDQLLTTISVSFVATLILKIFLHKMNFFMFTVVVLIANQEAYAIKCHKCLPTNAEIASAARKGDFSGLNLCSNPNDSFDCSQDLNIGIFADACYTANVTMNISVLNISEVKYHVLDCAIQSMCSPMEKSFCDKLKNEFSGWYGFGVSQCVVRCCQGDLCNNPSGIPATTSSASSVKSQYFPSNAAVFGILCFATVWLLLACFEVHVEPPR